MMHEFHELLKEVVIYANQMVENQTDFCTAWCFLVDIQISLYIIFSIALPNIGNKEPGL